MAIFTSIPKIWIDSPLVSGHAHGHLRFRLRSWRPSAGKGLTRKFLSAVCVIVDGYLKASLVATLQAIRLLSGLTGCHTSREGFSIFSQILKTPPRQIRWRAGPLCHLWRQQWSGNSVDHEECPGRIL